MSLSVNANAPCLAFASTDTFLSTKKVPKSLPPDTIFGLEMYPKCFCGRSSARTHWGAHSAPPDLPAGFGGLLCGREGRATGREGHEGGEGKVEGERGREGGEEKGKGSQGAGAVVLGGLTPLAHCLMLKVNVQHE